VTDAFISQVSAQTLHIKSIKHNGIPIISLKTLYTGGIRTRVFWSWRGCDVHCATPPGPKTLFFIERVWIMYLFNAYDIDTPCLKSQSALNETIMNGAGWRQTSPRLRRRDDWPELSVTRLGENFSIWAIHNFSASGAFFMENIAKMTWAQFYSKISPKIYLNTDLDYFWS
jgi:hypothetical protein